MDLITLAMAKAYTDSVSLPVLRIDTLIPADGTAAELSKAECAAVEATIGTGLPAIIRWKTNIGMDEDLHVAVVAELAAIPGFTCGYSCRCTLAGAAPGTLMLMPGSQTGIWGAVFTPDSAE